MEKDCLSKKIYAGKGDENVRFVYDIKDNSINIFPHPDNFKRVAFLFEQIEKGRFPSEFIWDLNRYLVEDKGYELLSFFFTYKDFLEGEVCRDEYKLETVFPIQGRDNYFAIAQMPKEYLEKMEVKEQDVKDFLHEWNYDEEGNLDEDMAYTWEDALREIQLPDKHIFNYVAVKNIKQFLKEINKKELKMKKMREKGIYEILKRSSDAIFYIHDLMEMEIETNNPDLKNGILSIVHKHFLEHRSIK
ncbi:MAG: hypothetical protein ACOX05_07255 [Bacillota bacterium]|jgi:hypothetical protein